MFVVVGAEIDFTEAIKLKPLNVDNYIVRASSRNQLLNYKGAFEDFESAIALEPNNSTIYLNRSISHINLQDYNSAIKDCETALQYHSKKELVYLKWTGCRSSVSRLKYSVLEWSNFTGLYHMRGTAN